MTIQEIDKKIADLQKEKSALIREAARARASAYPADAQVAKFLGTYSGQDLLKKYQLSESGTWKVFGEDPNCDFGGGHHMPELGVVSGTLEKCLLWAVHQRGFWQWGNGGEIRKIEIKTL